MKETEFKFDFENYQVLFSDGTVCEISPEKGNFFYRGKEFIMESDVEKDLQYAFGKRFIDMTEYED